MRLTGRIHGYQFLPVTDGNTPWLATGNEVRKAHLQAGKKWGPSNDREVCSADLVHAEELYMSVSMRNAS